MTENPYKSGHAIVIASASPKRTARYIVYTVLALGIILLIQGAIAFYFRVNVLTGTRYGPSLTPVYIILSGVGISVVGLALKTFADRKPRQSKTPGD
jgi:ABC-type Fe3+-siderophore transport system permease subunit